MSLYDLTQTISVPARFCGPPGWANGGYIGGVLTRGIVGPASVRLHRPIPIGQPLELVYDEARRSLYDGDGVKLAEATPATLDLVVPPVPAREAERDPHLWSTVEDHPFPRCFVCGPARSRGDGLAIRPVWTAGREMVIALWEPDSSLAAYDGTINNEYLWAALDCPGAFALSPEPEVALLLGELVVDIGGVVEPERPYRVVGWPLGRERRKRYAGTALIDGRGQVVGRARATWIAVDR